MGRVRSTECMCLIFQLNSFTTSTRIQNKAIEPPPRPFRFEFLESDGSRKDFPRNVGIKTDESRCDANFGSSNQSMESERAGERDFLDSELWDTAWS
jgi:hypothetical protein